MVAAAEPAAMTAAVYPAVVQLLASVLFLATAARESADYAYIDIGKVKTSADYRSAVRQLGVRSGVLRWLVSTCLQVPFPSITCVGRMSVPCSRHSADLDQQQQAVADSVWGYSLYLYLV